MHIILLNNWDEDNLYYSFQVQLRHFFANQCNILLKSSNEDDAYNTKLKR